MQELTMKCPKCAQGLAIKTGESAELSRFVEEIQAEAFEDGKDEGLLEGAELEAEEVQHELVGEDRAFFELSAAICAGRRDDALHHLERLADSAGSRAKEQVELGRWSPHARPV